MDKLETTIYDEFDHLIDRCEEKKWETIATMLRFIRDNLPDETPDKFDKVLKKYYREGYFEETCRKQKEKK